MPPQQDERDYLSLEDGGFVTVRKLMPTPEQRAWMREKKHALHNGAFLKVLFTVATVLATVL